MTGSQRYKEIQLAQLRSFCLAATEGNFTSAARALGLAPSTVWQQVRALERHLRARLLRRKGRSVELTDEGRLLLELIQPHVSGLDSLQRAFEARRAQAVQEIVLASGAYLLAHHLGQPVQQFRSERPTIQLTLRISAWSALQRLIDRGEVDLAVLAVDPDVPRSSSLEYEYLFDEPLCLLAPAEHPLTRAKTLRPDQVVEHPLILPPRGGADRKAIDRFLCKHNLLERVQTAVVCGLIDVAKQYVSLGVGVALLYVTDEVLRTAPGLRLRVLDPEIERLPIEMAVRKGAHLPEHVQELRQVIRRNLAQPRSSSPTGTV
jgi:DNA-binding transcriptional LysR family regulator